MGLVRTRQCQFIMLFQFEKITLQYQTNKISKGIIPTEIISFGRAADEYSPCKHHLKKYKLLWRVRDLLNMQEKNRLSINIVSISDASHDYGVNMLEITVTEHLLQSQLLWSPQASGELTSLMHDLIVSAKIINRQVSQAGLVDVLGGTGEVNVQGEYVQKLDEFANQVLVYRMQRSGSLYAIGSEEEDEIIICPPEHRGAYLLYFDPLDGSSNIDVNISIGTIFSIFRRRASATGEMPKDRLLRAGLEQVCAGYFLYGPSAFMVYTTGHGVHGFTLDPSIGEFLLSHPDMMIPQSGDYYSVNTSNEPYWDEKTKKAVNYFANPEESAKPYSMRYVGSLVADFHRTLLKGGVFLYPRDTKRPDGKLRIVYEATPLAFLAEQAGGKATDGEKRIMEIKPDSVHQRTPLIIGSTHEVDLVTSMLTAE